MAKKTGEIGKIDADHKPAGRSSRDSNTIDESSGEKENAQKEGIQIYELAKRIFPICRSITGNGVRETFKIIKEHIPIKISEVPTGTPVFDWTIPKEWNIKAAFIKDSKGKTIVDFKNSNLHVVGYSVPVNKKMNLTELQEHLYSLENQPDAIPYITSYYKENWGFCIAHSERKKLKEDTYTVFIDSELKDGFLTAGELIIPGKSQKEIFLTTYICHPSMANNECSGPALATYLAKWIMSTPRYFTYRILFTPETIGAIAYLSKNINAMKENIVAGFNITCVGDNRAYTFLPSKEGNTLADKVARNILSSQHPDFKIRSFLERGSNERQYCSPGVDLPVVSIMRTMYSEYPEYHTSLDNMEVVSPDGFQGSFDVMKECITILECNRKYKIKCLGEPYLSKHGLYPDISTKDVPIFIKNLMNTIVYLDGNNDVIDISNKIHVSAQEILNMINQLKDAELVEEIKD